MQKKRMSGLGEWLVEEEGFWRWGEIEGEVGW